MAHSAMSAAVVLPNSVIAAALAREHLAQVCAGCSKETVQTGQLLVSELVANAVRHGAGPIRMDASITADGVHVEVEDGGAGLPTPREPSPEGGRGLRMVDALAERWGVTRVTAAGSCGKRVWFDLLAG